MLYWGIFTSGFIIGVIFALFIATAKEKEESISDSNYTENTESIRSSNTSNIFERITQINYNAGKFKER